MICFVLSSENLAVIKTNMFYLVKEGFSYAELYDMEINDFQFMVRRLSKDLNERAKAYGG